MPSAAKLRVAQQLSRGVDDPVSIIGTVCDFEKQIFRRSKRRSLLVASSRTSALQAAASCSASSCTWARSTPRRLQWRKAIEVLVDDARRHVLARLPSIEWFPVSHEWLVQPVAKRAPAVLHNPGTVESTLPSATGWRRNGETSRRDACETSNGVDRQPVLPGGGAYLLELARSAPRLFDRQEARERRPTRLCLAKTDLGSAVFVLIPGVIAARRRIRSGMATAWAPIVRRASPAPAD